MNVYILDTLNNKFTKIYEIRGIIPKKYYKYFENQTKLMIVDNNEIIYFDNNGEIKFRIKYDNPDNNFTELLDIIEHKNNYYFITNTKITILDNNLNFEDYDIPNYTEQYSYKCYCKLLIHNDELYITYYIMTYEDGENINIKLELLKADYKNNIFIKTLLFDKTFPSYIDYDPTYTGYQLGGLCIYNEYIISAITDNTTKKTLILSYNLNSKQKIKVYIDYIQIHIKIFENNLLITNYLDYTYQKRFILYDIFTLKFKHFIKIDIKPKNGYFKFYSINNKLYIIPYNIGKVLKKENIIIYDKEITERDIKLMALAVKHIFKNKLNIDYGYHQDIKKYIINYINVEIDLDEEDRVISYKNMDNNYKFVTEIVINS